MCLQLALPVSQTERCSTAVKSLDVDTSLPCFCHVLYSPFVAASVASAAQKRRDVHRTSLSSLSLLDSSACCFGPHHRASISTTVMQILLCISLKDLTYHAHNEISLFREISLIRQNITDHTLLPLLLTLLRHFLHRVLPPSLVYLLSHRLPSRISRGRCAHRR